VAGSQALIIGAGAIAEALTATASQLGWNAQPVSTAAEQLWL
jgi:hypothetical protein